MAFPGECPVPGCLANEDCAPGEFCMTATGDCGGEGECTFLPDFCIDILDPVCGCNGVTYNNACFAAQDGQSAVYSGECACLTNDDCAPEEYCMKATGDCGGEGECSVLPDFCIDIYDPVCGCNDATYTNECFAAQDSQNVAFTGECP